MTRYDELTVARFWSRVDRSGGPSACWTWTAGKSEGYGRFGLRNGRFLFSHRMSWEIANGQSIPAGLYVLHDCDNRPCVNPAHLHLGTPQDNMREKIERGRAVYPNRLQTHCKYGHPLSGDNVYNPPYKPTARQCRTCKRRISREHNKRQSAVTNHPTYSDPRDTAQGA